MSEKTDNIALIKKVLYRFRNTTSDQMACFIIMALDEPRTLKQMYPEVFNNVQY